MSKVKKRIGAEIDEFKREPINITDGVDFHQYEQVRKNYRLYMGKFKGNKYEKGEDGNNTFRKYFYNIVRNPCNTATKQIDFDTKDIEINGKGSEDRFKAWFLQRDLEHWLKESNFSTLINDTVHMLPLQGSQVWKFIDNKPYLVDLRNFFVEQSADSLDEASYIIDRHIYTPRGFKKAAKTFKWEDKVVNKLIDKAEEEDNPKIIVYERYGEVDNEYKRVYYGEVKKTFSFFSESESIRKSVSGNGHLLKEESIDEHPYEELHFEKTKGRWLGVSIPEILEDAQVRMNELSNMKVKASYWAALQIFQSKDGTLESNLLEDVKNGTVLDVMDNIDPVATEERNLAAYNQEEQRWMQNIQENTFSYQGVRGESLPARTPLGSKELSVGLTAAHFDIIRQRIAERVKEILYDRVLPSFKKDRSAKHMLKISSDVNALQNTMLSHKADMDFIDMVDRNNGRLPTQEEASMSKKVLAQQIKDQDEVTVNIPEDFYEDLEYDIDIIITGEAEDVRAQNANLQVILQAVASNPAMLKNKFTKNVIEQIADKSGLDMANLMDEDMETVEDEAKQQQQAGGGVSKPNIPNTPQRQQTTRRV